MDKEGRDITWEENGEVEKLNIKVALNQILHH